MVTQLRLKHTGPGATKPGSNCSSASHPVYWMSLNISKTVSTRYTDDTASTEVETKIMNMNGNRASVRCGQAPLLQKEQGKRPECSAPTLACSASFVSESTSVYWSGRPSSFLSRQAGYHSSLHWDLLRDSTLIEY